MRQTDTIRPFEDAASWLSERPDLWPADYDLHAWWDGRVSYLAFAAIIEEFAATTEAQTGDAKGQTEPTDIDPVLEAVRAEVLKNRNAKPDNIIRNAGVARQTGRAALRKLQRRGEYNGFTRQAPARYRKA
jgi:hypothetical protein